MSYLARLLALESYRQALRALEDQEADRIYCKHNLDHFLDVARVTMLVCADFDIPADKDVVYLAALMHDLGRLDKGQADHPVASAQLADQWLEAIDFPADRRPEVIRLIEGHGWRGPAVPSNLLEAFSLADSLSRPCYQCPATDSCHWPADRKNAYPRY